MTERKLKPSQRKTQATKLDGIVAQFDADTKAAFMEFCSGNTPCADIQRWLRERGHELHIGVVQRWYRNTFPVGPEAKRLNALLAGYNQISPKDSLQFGLSLAVDQMLEWKEAFDELRKIEAQNGELTEKQTREKQRLQSMIPAYLREIRSISNDIQNMQVIRDREELERSGAYAVAQELLIVFRDSPFEDALKEAIRGAMAKVEGR